MSKPNTACATAPPQPCDIKVLVVADSAVVRKVMIEVLRAQQGIEVLGAAPDPLFAMQRMRARYPDVIVLDVALPRLNGVTFLRKLMHERPTPVVICSTITKAAAPPALEALGMRAATFITRPKLGVREFLTGAAGEIAAAIRVAADASAHPAAPHEH